MEAGGQLHAWGAIRQERETPCTRFDDRWAQTPLYMLWKQNNSASTGNRLSSDRHKLATAAGNCEYQITSKSGRCSEVKYLCTVWNHCLNQLTYMR
jgi:hypothetical protein